MFRVSTVGVCLCIVVFIFDAKDASALEDPRAELEILRTLNSELATKVAMYQEKGNRHALGEGRAVAAANLAR